MLVKASRGEVIEYDPDGLVGDQACSPEWHAYVETVDDHVVEGSAVAASRWRPMMQYVRA
jgi:hypothetical protein